MSTVQANRGVKKRALLIGLALLVTGAGVAGWQLTGKVPTRAPVPTVVARRRNVVVTVGGLGKVVDVHAATHAFAPSGSAGGSTGSSSAAASASAGRAVFPSAAGRVVSVLVAPGQRVALGQPVAVLDSGAANLNLVIAQASLDQARAQLEADRSGVTPQTLAVATAGIAASGVSMMSARQGLADTIRVNRDTLAVAQQQLEQAQAQLVLGSRQGLADTIRVNRDTLAVAHQQVEQARAQVALDATALGPSPQSLVSAQAQLQASTRQHAADVRPAGPNPGALAAARSAVVAAQTNLVTAQVALENTRAADGQQITSAQHGLDAAESALAVDQAKLARDLQTQRYVCGTSAPAPTITVDTSAECSNAVNAAASDQQAIVKDQASLQAARDAFAQAPLTARQSEHLAQAQVNAAGDSLDSARGQLAALQVVDAQTVTRDTQALSAAQRNLVALIAQNRVALVKDHQALATARTALAQARSRADQSTRQATGQLHAASLKDHQALATARTALAQARSRADQSTRQATGQLRASAVGVSNARAALVALEEGAPRAVVAQDEAKLRAAAAQVHAAQVALAQTVVRASESGTVTWVYVAPNSPVDAATPIIAVADLQHLAVNLDLSEFDAALVRKGMRAVVRVDALGGMPFPAKVQFEALAGVDNGGVVTFPVRVALGRVPEVKLGMNVSVRIVVAERHQVVTVPLEALSHADGRPALTVTDGSSRQQLRHVRVGLAGNKFVEITSGLRPGERVLLTGGTGA